MKKLAIFVAAFVLTLGLAQCKKEQPNAETPESETVRITVNVGNSGSRADINLSNGHITFNNGDKLYVGYNGKKVGELTFSNSYSVNIQWQHSVDPRYPVISCGTSTNTYTGAGNYTSTLENKCSLVKFSTNLGWRQGIIVYGTVYGANPLASLPCCLVS